MEKNNVEMDCSLIQAINVLGKKWAIFILTELIIRHVQTGSGMYFNELQKRVKDNYGGKISSRVLTDSLQLLEKTGLLDRKEKTDKKPFHVMYSLTEKGIDIQIVLSALKGWGIKHGGINQKKCQNFSCVHDSVPYINIDESWDILVSKPEKSDSDVEIVNR